MNEPVDMAMPSEAQVELRAWRQFLALAELLHFGRAAQRLHMTQPPLTQSIQSLERKVGVLLFERTRRSVALTPAGAALVAPVRQMLQQANALAGLARAVHGGAVGRLRLDFVSTVAFGPLPGWLRGFRDAQPGISVTLREATTDVQLRSLESAETDAGFVLHAPGMVPTLGAGQAALQRHTLGIERMLVALQESSVQASAKRLSIPQLLALPLVIFPREIAPSLYDAVIAFYHRQGTTPVIAQEAIQMQTIVNLVSGGLGIAWVPESMSRLQRPGVVYRRLPAFVDAEAPRSETSLLWRSDAGAATERFAAFVSAHPERG